MARGGVKALSLSDGTNTFTVVGAILKDGLDLAGEVGDYVDRADNRRYQLGVVNRSEIPVADFATVDETDTDNTTTFWTQLADQSLDWDATFTKLDGSTETIYQASLSAEIRRITGPDEPGMIVKLMLDASASNPGDTYSAAV